MKRWQKHIEKTLDQKDFDDARNLNQDNGQAEYAQNNYLMLRHQEESNRIKNYFDKEKEVNSGGASLKKYTRIISGYQRSTAVYLMIELNLKRRYEIDTLFMGVNILDRYLSSIGPQNFNSADIDLLACSCLLIAAKLEQPQLPNYQNMIFAYDELVGQKKSTFSR